MRTKPLERLTYEDQNIVKRLLYLLFALILVTTTSTLGESITFTFANRTITGTSPKFLEIDVMIAGGTGAQRLVILRSIFNYNTSGFGIYPGFWQDYSN